MQAMAEWSGYAGPFCSFEQNIFKHAPLFCSQFGSKANKEKRELLFVGDLVRNQRVWDVFLHCA